MDLSPNQADEEFRRRVRAFLLATWVRDNAGNVPIRPGRDAFRMAAELLREHSWLVPHWPVEWGGAGLPPAQRYILEDELLAVGAPPRDRIATELVGPVIYTFGTAQQKRRYLPRIIDGSEIWCQGFSEPEAGSDVGSLRTSATQEGSYYVIEGRKIWTTNAHFADMMFALVRLKVGTRLQQGLTFILLSMHEPGVSVRPIQSIDGEQHFNEVTLDKVRVPASNVVGELGRGWANARFLLGNERILLSRASDSRRTLSRVKQLAAEVNADGRRLCEDLLFRRRVADAEMRLLALEYLVLRVLHGDRSDPMIEGLTCAAKLRGAELRQELGELLLETIGTPGLPVRADAPADRESDHHAHAGWPIDRIMSQFLFNRSATIAGGTSEIQRNIIAAVTLNMSE